MRVFRLIKARYSPALLSGEGGLLAEGRWHSVGRRIVYAASCEALTVLEVRVHLGRSLPGAGERYAMHVIDLPDSAVEVLPLERYPDDWRHQPPRPASQAIGDAWLEAHRSLALRVPSVHSHSDATLLLNPAHAAAAQLEVLETRPYQFDPRLFAA